MWVLEQEHLGEHRYILYDRTKYTIGRISSDIVLPSDSSVSRQHAFMHVSDAKLYLEDNSSKYGTFYYTNISNCVRLKSGERQEIRAGDRVRFGMLKNKWIISQVKYHVLCSTLSVQQLCQLQTQLKTLGGKIETHPVATCTHLTMPKLSMTPKLLYALIKHIPIVNCDFWTQILHAIKERKPLPKSQDFSPTNALKVNLDTTRPRQKLFANLLFIFLDKQVCATYQPIVEAAGGQVGILADNFKQQVLQPHVLVIEFLSTSASESSQLYNEVSSFLLENGLRAIPEFEIAMAIIECNMYKWCNNAKEATEIAETGTEQESMHSMEALSCLRVSESPELNREPSQLVQKRKHESIFESDSEDEDELVALTKRSCINKESTLARPVTPPPLALEPAPVFVSAFRALATSTEGSQARILREQAEDASRARNRAEARAKAEARAAARVQTAYETAEGTQIKKAVKRTRIAVLDDNDDKSTDNNDDNLFDFAFKREKRTTRQATQQQDKQNYGKNTSGSGSGSGASDDELFKKPKPKPKEPMPEVESLFEFDLLAKSKLRKEQQVELEKPSTSRAAMAHTRAKKNVAVLTPMKLPSRINTEGWLQKTKLEAGIKAETDLEEGMRIVPLDLSKTRIAMTTDANYTNTKVFRKCQPAGAGGERQIIPTKMQTL